MRKFEWIDKLSKKTGLYKYQAKMFYEAYTEILIEELKENRHINLFGIGTFYLRDIERVEVKRNAHGKIIRKNILMM